jgi:hypothetical protein
MGNKDKKPPPPPPPPPTRSVKGGVEKPKDKGTKKK